MTAEAVTFDFMFEPPSAINREHLSQGDLLRRTPELAAAIGQAHSYYATAPSYSHYLVLTQSCDLVRRKGGCKSRYITLCAVRPLQLAVEREMERFTDPLEGCPVPIGSRENNVLARQFLERVLNNTVEGIFFIPKGSAESVDEHLCAFLPLSIALRANHYDVCLGAKVGQTKEIFAAKIGSLASNLYARIATPDLHERHDNKSVQAYTKAFLEDLGYSNVLWLTSFERSELERRVATTLAETGEDELSAEEAVMIVKTLPRQVDVIAERMIEVLTAAKIIADDPDTARKARNLLKNDPRFQRLARR